MEHGAAVAASRGLDWLLANQSVTGEVSSWVSPLGPPERAWAPDSLNFITALVAIVLDDIDDPRATEIVDRAVAFLRQERERAGQWRYWAKGHRQHDLAPPDADDTVCCSMAVARRGDDTTANIALLLAHRDEVGRFYTWLTPRRSTHGHATWWAMRDELRSASRRARRALWETTEAAIGDVDAVVNANVCRYLGPDRAPPEATRWVAEVIRAGQEATADKWHRNRFTMYAAVADGARRGIDAFAALGELIAERIEARVKPDGTVGSALDTANALLALQAFDTHVDLRHRLGGGLLASQLDDGHWARSVFYYGGPQEVVGWASEALATACATTALATEAGVVPADPTRARPPIAVARPAPRHLLTVIASAERSEATTSALELSEWLHRSSPWWKTSTLILGRGGALEGQFASLGETVVADRAAPAERHSWREEITGRFPALRLRLRLRRLGPIDAIHVHGVDALRRVPALPAAPVLGHLYETPSSLDLGAAPGADRYVAVSGSVAEALSRGVGVPHERIEQQPGFLVSAPAVADVAVDRDDLGVDGDAFLVMSTGDHPWRDGPEMFVRVARAAAAVAPEVPWRFVWIGGALRALGPLVEAGGLAPLVTSHARPGDTWAWLALADLLLVPARESALSAPAAAAAFGVPIVTFENGCASDLVTDADGGVVVGYPDVHGLVSALVALAREPGRRSMLGGAGRDHARRHLTIDQAGPALLDVLTRTMEEQQAR